MSNGRLEGDDREPVLLKLLDEVAMLMAAGRRAVQKPGAASCG
jgi:hypothetical protein